MQSISEIRAILGERGLRPRHRFGQNFLHDKNQLTKLVEAAHLAPGDLVLEVGPGTGTLTETLLERGADVIACELDRDMAGIIADRLGDRVTLIVGDALQRGRRLNPDIVAALAGRSFRLVANLPYNIASPLMAMLLLDHPNCAGQYITIQKEVADRLLAKSGTKEYGPLTVIAQAFGEAKRLATVKPTSFWPQPKVSSAMVAITPRGDHGVDDPAAFATFITQLFAKRRKQLGAIFGRERPAGAWPPGVTPDMRPESLSVEQLIALKAMADSP